MKKQQQQIGLTFRLPAKIVKKTRWYVASCPILDVHSQGKTPEAAKKNLVEALYVFLVSCIERGTLDAVLREHGFTPGDRTPPIHEEDYVKVPIPLLAHAKKQAECHAV
jgi:predicted RNase H-like HicB family nuclease